MTRRTHLILSSLREEASFPVFSTFIVDGFQHQLDDIENDLNEGDQEDGDRDYQDRNCHEEQISTDERPEKENRGQGSGVGRIFGVEKIKGQGFPKSHLNNCSRQQGGRAAALHTNIAAALREAAAAKAGAQELIEAARLEFERTKWEAELAAAALAHEIKF
ncbi:hypothetical protein BDK51DRAFT_32522 [Blyttiomyces helicus]|uniref:Uncharacterized protein n=1 Tax=Blyttiomyces helicus TaxID=388810 RepID=A0A4P9VZE8_9FUNG|nr:hypothetical protein BDK51DRAFT_32522 [Blyttiomyces helicus]|eukprot:RKO85189.1 hypothetical protein BDK51DRAFT_32522 [Blyttiomyces helicus]